MENKLDLIIDAFYMTGEKLIELIIPLLMVWIVLNLIVSTLMIRDR